MRTYLRQTIWIGGLASLAFSLLLHLALLWNLPPLNVALWDGSFFTINMAWATFWGLGLEWLVGAALVFAFSEYWAPRVSGPYWIKGAGFGVAWWAFMMLVGFPLLGLVSPLSRYGLAPVPGLFAIGEGAATPVFFLLAMVGFGLVAAFFLGTRRILGPFRWHIT